ncbi:pentapeptide repeat-containing protein [Bdellovibrio reynosensis]|uniref:Pentapeptide repeat-containing protein n=1 Tax=Bdellovibrio reynosensis TaxID=2835041 RepID=A0ABY4CCH1_9BACT|nr:pentapeptide repeat-containing protein [Bdellovibrio reynosensis]UOF02479.1 pentapeptide repeat-containing protein [Bdellovibrio reynosensis]
MINFKIYYSLLGIFLVATQLFPQGRVLFPPPKINSLYFPSKDQVFSPSFPVLTPGTEPRFPDANVILQENLYAPFSVLNGKNLSKLNLEKAHLGFADLRFADLKDTNLSKALLYGANLEGAIFNSETRLPFSKETAFSLGMKESP